MIIQSVQQGGGALVIGDETSQGTAPSDYLAFDRNSMQAYGGGATAALYINEHGGDVNIGLSQTGSDIRFQGEVEFIGSIASDVVIEGDLEIGYQIDNSAAVLIDDLETDCDDDHGGTCYEGEASFTCPAGTKLMGGGCSTDNYAATITSSYPSTGDERTWNCVATSGVNTHSVTAYATCARLGN